MNQPLVRCPVHTPVRTPVYGQSLSQSDQRIRSVFQSVYNSCPFSCKRDLKVLVLFSSKVYGFKNKTFADFLYKLDFRVRFGGV